MMKTLLALTALTPAVALAAPVDVERTQVRLDAATRLFESNLPADALEILREIEAELGADGESRFPLLRFMMARCLVALERPDEALAALARFEALARDDTERALAAEWTAKVRARWYGALTVECPEGGTVHIEGQPPPAPMPCPATFESLLAGRHAVRVDGLPTPLVADAEVVASESRAVTPVEPGPEPRWLWGGVALAGGTGLLGGPVPDGIEPGVGAHFAAELYGELAVLDGIGVRLGMGYAYTQLAFDDQALDLDGDWTRHGLIVPLDVRVDLPWDLIATLGGGLDVFLAGEEARADRTTDLADDFTALGGFARVGLERAVLEDVVDLRIALRYQQWLTPVFEAADPIMRTVDLGLHLVL